MDLKVYTLDQSEQWDNIVRTFKDYDTYWLSGYVKAFEIHGDGTPLLFYYEGSNTRGINVVMRETLRMIHDFKILFLEMNILIFQPRMAMVVG